MDGEHKPNIICGIVDNPNTSYQMLLTQDLDGKIHFGCIDHITKTTFECCETEFPNAASFIELARQVIDMMKLAHHNVMLFDIAPKS